MNFVRFSLLILILSGCANNQVKGTQTNKVACEAFAIISYSAKSDTPETVKEIRQHNAAYRAICQ